jgi:hypothetical protein
MIIHLALNCAELHSILAFLLQKQHSLRNCALVIRSSLDVAYAFLKAEGTLLETAELLIAHCHILKSDQRKIFIPS